jgi:hypothetical protein
MLTKIFTTVDVNKQAVKELKHTGKLSKATRLQLQSIIRKGVK